VYIDPATSHTGTLVRPFNQTSLTLKWQSTMKYGKSSTSPYVKNLEISLQNLRLPGMQYGVYWEHSFVSLASCTPTKVSKSDAWTRIVNSAQDDRAKLCEILRGKILVGSLYGVCSLTLNELKAVLQKCVCQTVTYWNLVMSPEGARHQDSCKTTPIYSICKIIVTIRPIYSASIISVHVHLDAVTGNRKLSRLLKLQP
jgi:hypothetical protein